MGKPLPPAEKRRRAVERTLLRYRNKEFDWEKGINCVALAHRHLKHMGRKPPTIPKFTTALGARKAMKAKGWASVVEMLDSMLPRIAPAEMLLGDLCAVEGEESMHAIFVCTGPRTMFGWAEGNALPVAAVDVSLDKLAGAWRV